MHFLNPHSTSLEYFTVTPPVATYIMDAPQHKTECIDKNKIKMVDWIKYHSQLQTTNNIICVFMSKGFLESIATLFCQR